MPLKKMPLSNRTKAGGYSLLSAVFAMDVPRWTKFAHTPESF